MKQVACLVGFVGLKSKMYTFEIKDNQESKRAKALMKMLLMMS